tara:strand:+ start:635 stop:1135 length:501 start_codon:yes stop_codon:yes gene_type:complete
MYGVINGLYRCSDKRVEDLNTRIYRRNVPSGKLQPLFDPRSVPTRYTTMPIIDSKTKANTFIEKLPIYSPHKTFNPGYRGPISGYKIDQDSRLRNIFFPLQKCPQRYYVPSTTSDLYNFSMMIRPVHMTHNLLFKEETFEPFNPNKCRTGENLFHNHTKYQIKNIF